VRLCTVTRGNEEIAAVVRPDGRLAPVSAIDPRLPTDLLGLLEVGIDPAVAEALEARAAALAADRCLDPQQVRAAPLYRRPRKIWGIGLNYRAHAQDLAAPYPTEPASFIKGDHTIIGPDDPIQLPTQSRRVTAEAELGLVIGRHCRDVEEDDALSYVAGVCPILDQTAEDILERNPRFLTRSKNFPSFFSFGPQLVTLTEVFERFERLEDIVVATEHNGSTHREDVVGNMAYSPAYLVSFHSKVMPLFPGDVISTGTPGAVVVQDGDVVACRIDGVGTLRNPVVRAVGSGAAGEVG
jgi:2-keto-4-pentenoate hydratase/2-oxohepta-3-ene-1,7-dioic acid hydratase in catechol pathway